METYRKLTSLEIKTLVAQDCHCDNWDDIMVKDGFNPKYVRATRFSGVVKLGLFKRDFELVGSVRKHSGIFHTTLHNVTVGDNCCIEHVNNYIANYVIGHDTFIENVDIIVNDGESMFGNGVEVPVLNEMGGREVMIYDGLSAQTAYVLALYRHRSELVRRLYELISDYASSQRSSMANIGSNVWISDAEYIRNVRIGDSCKIEGASRLYNGSINSTSEDPVHIGVGVIGNDFIISSGTSVEDAVMFSRCFIGQACHLGHSYSATDSLFFSNCHGENGEACSIFAGPFTVTHHKSTLLIAGMYSFMNAGSGSNQSNHMYKLGPIHQGILERGAKTTSDSYILYPARVGMFSLVMGRHTDNLDTSDLPFSYLIENQGVTYIFPGANLRSVGTIRDAKKWPQRDRRKDSVKLDSINYNLLSPYAIQKMINGSVLLKRLKEVSGYGAREFIFGKGRIKASSLDKGLKYYDMAIVKFLGNSIIKRLENLSCSDDEQIRARLFPDAEYGLGTWIDLSGMIAPKIAVDKLLGRVEDGCINDIRELDAEFACLHSNYYNYEWTWAYKTIGDYFGIDMAEITAEDIVGIVQRWKEAVVGLDRFIYEDARKEFSLSALTGYGADGDEKEKGLDFFQVRGSSFENNPVVVDTLNHIKIKSALGDELISRLRKY